MIVKSQVKVGGTVYIFEAEEEKDLDSMHKAIVLGNPRSKCNVCGDEGLESKHFTSNKSAKDGAAYTFVNLKCKCGARSQLGQYKAGGYFWKEYEKYEGAKQATQSDDPDLDDPTSIGG